jgi:hypothetical protein
MAVRFDASGESYSRTLSLGSITTFTVSFWVKLASNRAISTILWQIDSGSANWLAVRAWDGTSLAVETDGGWNSLLGHTLTVGTWCYIGVCAQTSGALNTVIGDAGGTLTASTPNFGATTFNGNLLRIGVGGASTGWVDGSIAAFKAWNAVLTTAELDLEARAYQPRRTTNLLGWYPFLTPSTVDLSGLGNTLTGGTGATTEDGPPIGWRQGRRRTVLPAPPSVQAALAATLPSLTSNLTGNVAASGDVSGTLPALTSSISGAAKASGTVAAPLPPLTGVLAGNVSISALSAVLPALTGTLTGTVKASGSLAGALPSLTGVLSGEVEIPPDDITITTPGPRRGWAAGSPADGWASPSAGRGWAAGSPTT